MRDSFFDHIWPFTHRWEGGYCDDEGDPGGATNHGVCLRFLRTLPGRSGATRADIRALTEEQARDILRDAFWRRHEALPGVVDEFLFDMGMNCGAASAVRALQRVVGATCDGVYGPRTEAATRTFLARYGLADLLGDLCDERLARYRRICDGNPRLSRFMKGWRNRTEDLRRFLLEAVR